MPRLGNSAPARSAIALTLCDVWRRLPPKQRKQVLELARKHGPKAAAKLIQLQRARRGALEALRAESADGASAARTIRSCSRRCAVG